MSRFDSLGPLPVAHHREKLVNEAELDLIKAYTDIIKQKDLTTAEVLRVVTNFVHRSIGNIAKYAIRHERHPDDPEKPGGWE